MTKEELIRNLKYTMEKHKNDKVNTFGTNISLMCKDVLDYLEQQPSDDYVSRKAMLNAITEIDDNINMDIYTNEVREIIKELPPVIPTFPKGVTNGDVIKALFPYGKYGTNGNEVHVFGVGGNGIWVFNLQWWNAPYRKENIIC